MMAAATASAQKAMIAAQSAAVMFWATCRGNAAWKPSWRRTRRDSLAMQLVVRRGSSAPSRWLSSSHRRAASALADAFHPPRWLWRARPCRRCRARRRARGAAGPIAANPARGGGAVARVGRADGGRPVLAEHRALRALLHLDDHRADFRPAPVAVRRSLAARRCSRWSARASCSARSPSSTSRSRACSRPSSRRPPSSRTSRCSR